MKKEFYQSTLDFVYKKGAELRIPYTSLYWNLDGVISCAVNDNEISFDDFNFLLVYRNTKLEEIEK